jgi:His/Glu/Gln/Arg/opine family amino acid ABC transporter permease subunit
MFNYMIASKALPLLLQGTIVSIGLWGIALSMGFVAGTLLGIGQSRGPKILQWMVAGYVWFIQGTPMLVQLSFLYYVLPMVGIVFSGFWTAALAIGINSSAYMSQIIRSGMNAVAVGTVEAAQVLGFSKLQAVWYIILPQAIRIVLPALANEGVTLIKDTSLASIIGVMEVYKVATGVINQTYDVVTLFVMLACIYLILTSVFSMSMSIVQKRMNQYGKH